VEKRMSSPKAPPTMVKVEGPTVDEVPPLIYASDDEEEARESTDPPAQAGEDSVDGGLGEVEVLNPGNFPDAIISDADRMMDKVYGDHVHQNPGTHLDGGIADDTMWQDYHRRLIVYPSQRYDAPSGSVGRRFVESTATLLDGVQARKWNSERFLLFQMVVMQRTRDVSRSRDIRKRITRRIDDWDAGKFKML
jgi:hypothetical protein